jgi:hypothetical protein
MLDLLHNYYWVTEESEVKVTKNRNLTTEEISAIRRELLNTLDSIIVSITLEETQAIVYFLQESNDALQLCDVLQLLYSLLHKQIKQLTIHLETLGGLRPFYCLIYKQNESVREMSIKVIGKYLQLSPKLKTKILNEHSNMFCSQTFALSVPIYYALIELLLEDFSLERKTAATHSKLIAGDNNKKFVNPQMLAPIFQSLESASAAMIQKVLQEFILCFSHSTAACDTFAEQDNWQGWLLAILCSPACTQPADAKDDAASKETEVIREMIVSIFERVLHLKFLSKDGWKYIEHTDTVIQHYSRHPQYKDKLSGTAVELSRTLFFNLLSSIEGTIIESDTKSFIWKNLVNVMVIIHDFMFHPQLHRHNDKWADFELAVKVLDIFDVSLRPPNNEHLLCNDLHANNGRDIFTVILKITLHAFQESTVHYLAHKQQSSLESDSEESEAKVTTTNADLERLFFKNVQRVRHILLRLDASGDVSGNEQTIMWVLHYLFKAFKRALKSSDSSYVIIIPLIKELFRRRLAALESFELDPEYIAEVI